VKASTHTDITDLSNYVIVLQFFACNIAIIAINSLCNNLMSQIQYLITLACMYVCVCVCIMNVVYKQNLVLHNQISSADSYSKIDALHYIGSVIFICLKIFANIGYRNTLESVLLGSLVPIHIFTMSVNTKIACAC